MKKIGFNKKQMVTSGVLSIIVLVVISIVIIHTCKKDKTNLEMTAQEVQGTKIDETDNAKSEVEESSQDTKVDEDNESESEIEDFEGFRFVENESGDIYDELLAGEGTISFSYYIKNVFGIKEEDSWDEDELIGLLPAQKFTLEQLVEAIDEIFASSDDEYERDYKVESIRYTFIDCGMDGNRELVLEIGCPFYYGPSGIYLVIKDIDSQLQVIYAGVSANRNWFNINEYGGVIRSACPGNPTPYIYEDYGFIDNTGKIKSIYTTQTDYGIYAFAINSMDRDFAESEELMEKDRKLEGEILIYTLNYGDNKYYSYEVFSHDAPTYEWELLDIPNLYTDSKYKKALDEFSECEFISMDEFNKIRKERLADVGASEEMIDDKELNYIPIYRNNTLE